MQAILNQDKNAWYVYIKIFAASLTSRAYQNQHEE